MQAIPAAIFFLALLRIPESPRFLMAKQRDAKALTVLTRLFGEETGCSPARAVEKLRLEAARLLVSQGRLAIDTIADFLIFSATSPGRQSKDRRDAQNHPTEADRAANRA